MAERRASGHRHERRPARSDLPADRAGRQPGGADAEGQLLLRPRAAGTVSSQPRRVLRRAPQRRLETDADFFCGERTLPQYLELAGVLVGAEVDDRRRSASADAGVEFDVGSAPDPRVDLVEAAWVALAGRVRARLQHR